MKIKLICVFFGLFTLFSVQADAQFGLRIGSEIPTGEWASFQGIGIGGALSYKVKTGDKFRVGTFVGFYRMSSTRIQLPLAGPSFIVDSPELELYRLLGSVDYNLGSKIYTGIDMGVTFQSQESSVFNSDDERFLTNSPFTIVPKIGVKTGHWVSELRYNYFDFGGLAVHVGFDF